jgi:hypothetical protein
MESLFHFAARQEIKVIIYSQRMEKDQIPSLPARILNSLDFEPFFQNAALQPEQSVSGARICKAGSPDKLVSLNRLHIKAVN